MPRAAAAAAARSSGELPTCQAPVPALSSSIACSSSASATSCAITASAVGERQMLPRQTNRTRTIAGRLAGAQGTQRVEDHGDVDPLLQQCAGDGWEQAGG